MEETGNLFMEEDQKQFTEDADGKHFVGRI